MKEKEAAPPATPTQKPGVEVLIDAVRRQVSPITTAAQQPRIQEDTTSGKGKPKSGDNVATRPPEGRSEGKGGKSRQWRIPSGFAFHASEEMFTRKVRSLGVCSCSCTADKTKSNTHGNDDYADDYADAYNLQNGDECEDSHKGYDTSGDWKGEETSVLKSRRGKGKGNKVKRTLDPVINDKRRMLADLRTKTPCNYCGQKRTLAPTMPAIL